MSGGHRFDDSASKEIDNLRNENAALQEENRILKDRISFLEGHPTLSEGLRGKRLIHNIIGGMLTAHTESHDLELDTGELLKIKMANLNVAVKGYSTKRWAWGKIFGTSGAKNFDFIILVGHTDERFREHYLDPSSPYVFFLVPYDEIGPMTTKAGNWESIFLTTNPVQQKSKSSRLFNEYQVTIDHLHKRFGL